MVVGGSMIGILFLIPCLLALPAAIVMMIVLAARKQKEKRDEAEALKKIGQRPDDPGDRNL